MNGQRPDRVVILNDTGLARGGAAALALLSARLFRARDIPVTWLAGDDGQNPEFGDLGIEVQAAGGRELLAQGRLSAVRRGISNPDSADLVAHFVAERDTARTIYHVHAWALVHSPSIFRALHPVAARTFVHAHDSFVACPNSVYYDFQKGIPCTRRPLGASCILTHCDKRSYPQKLWRVVRGAMLRRTFPPDGEWAGLILIHPRQEALMRLAGFPASLLQVVRNPVTPFATARIDAEANSAALFVGRLEPDKGITDLIAAAKACKVPLIVVGDGPLRARLERENPNVLFTGWLGPGEVASHAAKARMLVMPSRFPEPFGMVAVEALQSGLPVVVPETAFLADEIAAGGLGLVYDPRNPDALTDALAQMACMPADAVLGMSRKGMAQEIRLALTPDDWAESLLERYGQALTAQGA
jgi:glycosyltransferase involved in cell wall biosynthesis